MSGDRQETTTWQHHMSTENISIPQTDVNKHSISVAVIIFQSMVSSMTVLGNLFIIRVVCGLPDSKLRRTTRMLICYLSTSYCIFSITVIARLFRLPCSLFLAGVTTGGINVMTGMLFLAFETFIVVTKPHSHRLYVSVKICQMEILITNLLITCINVFAYVTMREMDEPLLCYFKNGQFNVLVVFLSFTLCFVIVVAASIFQFCALRAMRKITPIGQSSVSTIPAPSTNIEMVTSPSTGTTHGRNIQKSPLQRSILLQAASLVCFIICWMPPVLSNALLSACELLGMTISIEPQVFIAFSALGVLNGILHVLVYFVMSSQIRQRMKADIRALLCFIKN